MRSFLHNSGPVTSVRLDRVGQAFLLFGVTLLLVVSVGFAVQSIWPRGGLAFTEIGLILLPALWFVRRKSLPLARGLRLTSVGVPTALLAVAVGVAGWGVAMLIHDALTGRLTEPAATLPPRLDVGGWAAVLFVGALLPGLCEEVLFRGAIMGVLERRGTRYAVAVTAVLFGVYHLSPPNVVPAIFLGLVFGMLVARTGSLLPAILAHTGSNATAIVAGQLAVDMSMVATTLAVTFLPLGGVMWLRTRQVAPPASPLASVHAAAPAMTPSRIAGLTAGAVILAVSLLVVSIFNVHRVKDVGLAPELAVGDLAIVAVDASRQRVLKTGDIVEFDSELANALDGRRLARVSEADGGRVLVDAGTSQVEVGRHQIVGKVVRSWRRFDVAAAHTQRVMRPW